MRTSLRTQAGAFIFVLLSCVLASAAFAAGTPRNSLVVTASWLAQHLKDPGIVLLHVGEKAEYEAGHIEGARPVGLDDVSVSEHSAKGLMLEMPSAEDLRHRLEALGISDNSRVIVYYGNDVTPKDGMRKRSYVTPATRIIFTLDYAGLGGRASLLDGGLPAWVRNGGALSKSAPSSRTGKLSPLKLRPIVVDAATVRSRIDTPGVAIVDGRSAVYYDGTETGEDHVKHRTGHIRGALSVPFNTITDDSLMLKSAGELMALFTRAGVKPDDTVIGYCHIGMQATGMLFAARTLGHPVLLYDGSFQDWSRHADYPVDNPSEKAEKAGK